MKLENASARPDSNLLEGDTEAAAYLRQKPRTIRLWRHTRGLPHIKITNKVILFRRADLDAWIDLHAVTIAPVRRHSVAVNGGCQ